MNRKWNLLKFLWGKTIFGNVKTLNSSCFRGLCPLYPQQGSAPVAVSRPQTPHLCGGLRPPELSTFKISPSSSNLIDSPGCDQAIPLFLRAKTLPIHFLFYKVLIHDGSNDVIPPQLKDLFIRTAKIHSYNMRSSVSNNFYIKKSKLEIERKSFSRIGARLWNEIPTKLWTLPKLIFKRKICMILFNILESEDSMMT